ncbi:MAG: hypothetical protein ACJ78L_05580 [Chloroflexota bacterium]
MTASEFSFLALGLVLGLVSGAAIIEFVRARPPAPREVRLTVSHDAVPRRSSTLADDAFTLAGPEPARGGPADRRLLGSPLPAGARDRRTSVRLSPAAATAAAEVGARMSAPGAIPIAREAGPPAQGRTTEPELPPAPSPSQPPAGPAPMVGIPVSTGEDPVTKAILDGPQRSPGVVAGGAANVGLATAIATAPPPAVVVVRQVPARLAATARPAPAWSGGAATTARTDASAEGAATTPPPPSSTSPVSGPAAPPAGDERCADERRIADERCELATRARAQAEAAADALRLAQRSYDAHEAAAVTASWGADPRAIHDAKDAAQGAFRSAVDSAKSPDALEEAARDWLEEINRINVEAKEAGATATREHAAASAIGRTLERLGLDADAARIGAENADAACLQARVLVADCDERTESEAAFHIPAAPSEPWEARLDEDERIGITYDGGGAPRIFRLLRGDRQTMTALVALLGGDDDKARRRWQLQLTSLVDAIIADAIEASALEFPEEHAFWSGFGRGQSRDIVRALSSLGYRFDGLGGWTDDRYPSQRDLSLALGYAGLDPMRIRAWPSSEETADLFRDVTVSADEYLAGMAGDLTLAEMVTMLGRRADGLAEVWNTWGRIRPLLLEEA